MANEFVKQEYLDKLKKMCLFDGLFFRKAFDKNTAASQKVLRTILEDDKIKVVKAKTEYTITGLASHSVQLDLLAMDSKGKYFNVEVQTESSGAPPQRARYYSGAVDTGHFPKNEDYSQIFDSYVIFITREDVLGKGLPIYHVERTIKETGESFNDGAYITYVNGEFSDAHTALGRLIHDFACVNSNEIYDDTLKECVKHFKETEEGIRTMCKVMDELKNEGRIEGRAEGRAEGKKQGMHSFAELTKRLLALGRTNDLNRATEDEAFRDKLFKEFAIQ